MLSSAHDKAAEALKRQYIFFVYFKSALDYFHAHNLEHVYNRYAVKISFFVAVDTDCRLKQATGFAFERSSAVVILSPEIRNIT